MTHEPHYSVCAVNRPQQIRCDSQEPKHLSHMNTFSVADGSVSILVKDEATEAESLFF